MSLDKKAIEIIVQGIVQGVGFRPFLYRTAKQLDLQGYCSNTEKGVLLFLQGEKEDLISFLKTLQKNAPSVSKIVKISVIAKNPNKKLTDFVIKQSSSCGKKDIFPPPDYATCSDCIRELFDPKDRRYLYPFINCTNCGPRFTIIRSLPYDRKNTTMSKFTMCHLCKQEYLNPLNRRFHAEPIACANCGPRLFLLDKTGKEICNPKEILDKAILLLNQGKILAIKGLGGFHLAVDARNDNAVLRLRKKKNRPHKPLAIMVASIKVANEVAILDKNSIELLKDTSAPIVLLKKRTNSFLSKYIAPEIKDIGIMLPYTPIHHLIFNHPNAPKALVMTSGNFSGLPICIDTSSAISELGNIADFFLTNNREIITRADDSVIRYIDPDIGSIMIRRSRGFVPKAIELPFSYSKTVLGCGGAMKTTFCLTKKDKAFLSQHIGELEYKENFDFYKKALKHLCSLLDISPEICALDLHPDYPTTRIGRAFKKPSIEVQHHHAHAVSVMIEHNLTSPSLAIILDGTGLGKDHTIWGGEVLLVGYKDYKRLAHLEYNALPGGDKATLEPWRMALSILYNSELLNEPIISSLSLNSYKNKDLIIQMIQKRLNTPLTSSCGRLFDAISSILGLCDKISYEAQAAMILESKALEAYENLSNKESNLSFPLEIYKDIKDGCLIIGCKTMLRYMLSYISKGIPTNIIALSFHRWLKDCFIEVLNKIRDQLRINQVILSGGCFQNRILLSLFINGLKDNKFKVYWSKEIPMSDAGISLGQVAVAIAKEGVKYIQ